MPRLVRRAGSLLLLGCLLALLMWMDEPEASLAADGVRVTVTDGDSLRIAGRAIRLADMDAVELHQSCHDEHGARWSCGEAARAALLAMVHAGGLDCISRTTDRYGRAVSLCSTAAVPDVSAAMVEQGWAVSGDGRRSGPYASEQSAARTAQRGIWRGSFERPAEWRSANPRND